MNIKPEQIPQGVVDLAVETFLSNTGQTHTVTELQRELTAKCIRPALAAALPVLLEKVAWMAPASRDVINAERKHEWMTYFGAGGKVKADLYTLPIYTLPTQDAPNADQ